MDKLSAFQITGMSLSGFKSYLEPTELIFGNPTVITGGNGKGKSSIADAIAFAVTGLPFFGERGIDRLHSDDAPELFVALRFADGEGKPHELTRTRYKGRMTITYDGYEIRQHNLTDLFGEKDVFLSIFNPLYFIEELGDAGKNLLERYLPAITHEEVLATLSDTVRASLEGESLLSPEVYLKRLRENIRELEESVIYLTGQKDLVEAQGQNGEKKAAERGERLTVLNSEIQALEDRQFLGLDLTDLREQMIDLSARYEELAKEGGTPDS
ncbi:MAG: AAA family ATPase, partial [Oscillospiraceae bacterium]